MKKEEKKVNNSKERRKCWKYNMYWSKKNLFDRRIKRSLKVSHCFMKIVNKNLTNLSNALSSQFHSVIVRNMKNLPFVSFLYFLLALLPATKKDALSHDDFNGGLLVFLSRLLLLVRKKSITR